MNKAHKAHNHAPAMRVEDPRLVTGAGRFAADWNLPGQLHAHFVRSDRAHAEIVSLETGAARKHPGVRAIFTGADAVRAGYTKPMHTLAFPGKGGMQTRAPERPALAHGKVRFVGEALAMVVADTAAAAQDAAELIEVQYRELAPVIAPEQALASGAPQLHESVPGNLSLEAEAGDAAAVEAAFARAAHVTRLKVEVTRVAPNPMEPRACLVAHEPQDDSYTFHVCMQGVTTLRRQMSVYTGVAEDRMRFVAHDVGGGFGQRTPAYPEYCALMLAAKDTGRPVKWVSTRSEGIACDTHGRANIIDGALALDRDGRFLGMRLDWVNDMGSYLSPASQGHVRNTSTCMTGVYRIPALYASYRVALTNTNPVSAYRGAGRPDVAYAIERLVSRAAAELGIDTAELRRRNFIPPEAFPYKTPTGSTYEYADLPGVLEKALKLADWRGYPKRRARSEKTGKLRGIGIATVIENTGAGQAAKDEVELELDARGHVTVHTVSKSQGHGHETTLAMIVADALGIPRERVAVRQCGEDRQHRLQGNHTGGSRSTVGAGSVCHIAARKLIEHCRGLAALELGVEPSQVDYAKGAFRSRESKRAVKLGELAGTGPVSVVGEGKFGSTFPNGCHIAEVEIDPGTGAAQIASYCAVDDIGTVINHAIVEGQLHGGVVMGAGQIFGEHVVYDLESGQLMTGSFMDYCMPRAGMVRAIRGAEHPTPSKVSPLGVKGVGESGCTGSLPALANAVADALRPLGVAHLDMPLTPAKIWHAVRDARKGGN
ncbi:MAG: xanthine dehydrogenase family protein molybdopterin-binding subunit [Betaproteobacteria bacterium]|nr:xanthine dehydrogenase family protein molybdopterin-binding subunit [Betaproteobacteria bacterium]